MKLKQTNYYFSPTKIKLFKVHVNILDVLYKGIKNKGTDRNREPEQAIYAFKIIALRS